MKSRNEKGFTLVELMVAVLVGLILMAGVFVLYRNTQETYISQEKLVEAQQNTRILLDQMAREFRLAGYVSACTPPYATATEFQFEADTDLDGDAERIYYKFIDDPSDLDYKTLFRAQDDEDGTCAQMDSPEWVAVAAGVEEIHFDYYDSNNGFLDPGGGALDALQLEEIRRVTIRVKDETVDPVTNQTRVVSQTSDIRLRNEGIADSGGCAMPEEVSGFGVEDIKVCGRVFADWTPLPDSVNVTSYRLYTRLNGTVDWTSIDDMGVGTNYTKMAGLVNGSTFDFAIAARTACGVGELSSPVTVTLDDDIGPQPATGLATTTTLDSLDIDLNWTASTTLDGSGNQVASDVQGYNVYRSNDGGTSWFGPVNSELITVLNYTDTVPTACLGYSYRIQAVDSCGNAGADSAAVNATPQDSVPPSEPAGFASVSGGRHGGPNNYRIGLSWQFPSELDTEGVRVLYKQQNSACVGADYPADPEGNTFHADETGSPGAGFAKNYDVFSNNKYYCFTAFAYDACDNYSAGSTATSQAKTCGDEPVGAPNAIDSGSLNIEKLSPKSPDGPTLGVEDAPGEHRGRTGIIWTTTQNLDNTPDLAGFNVYRTPAADDWGKTVSYNSKTFYGLTEAPVFFPSEVDTDFNDNAGALDDNRNTCVKFGADGTTDTTVANDDLPDATGINAGPDKVCDSTANSNPSGTADDQVVAAAGTAQNPYLTRKLIPGETYEYVVAVADCSEQVSNPAQYGISEHVTVMPGRLDRDLRVNVTTSGTSGPRHNIVNYGLRNTSASSMTMRTTDQATISWTNPDARLFKVTLGGTTLWSDAAAVPTTTSGSPITFTTAKTLAGGSGFNTMQLHFKDSTGDTKIDMRGNTIAVNFTHRNEQAISQTPNENYATVTADFSLTASTGIVFSDVKQSPPLDEDSLPVAAESSIGGDVPPGWPAVASSGVTVTAVATPASGSTISAIYLRYFVDYDLLSTAPNPSVTFYNLITMGCFVDSETAPNCSGNQFKATIPNYSGARIWFYVQGLDSKGRTSTSPNQTETDFIAYTYDQIGVSAGWNLDTSCANPKDDIRVMGVLRDDAGDPLVGASIVITMAGSVLDPDPAPYATTTGSLGEFSVISPELFDNESVTVTVDITKDSFVKSCTLAPVTWVPCSFPQQVTSCY